MVPKYLTHLLQPLDLTTDGSFKKIEKAAFSNYFTTTLTKELQVDPEKDVTTIKVDLVYPQTASCKNNDRDLRTF